MFRGLRQKIHAVQPVIPEALSLEEAVGILKGRGDAKTPL